MALRLLKSTHRIEGLPPIGMIFNCVLKMQTDAAVVHVKLMRLDYHLIRDKHKSRFGMPQACALDPTDHGVLVFDTTADQDYDIGLRYYPPMQEV